MQHAGNLTRETAARRREQVTLHAQTVHLDLSRAEDPQQETFSSTSTLRVSAEANEIAIDLVGDPVAVRVDNHLTQFRYENSLVHVPVIAGREHVITITAQCFYSRTGEGLHRLIDPAEGATYLYTHYEPTDARRVFACFDQPDMKTRFRMSARTPSGWKVRSNAEVESTSTTGEGDVLTRFEETKPLPTYIVCLIAGPYTEFTDSYERSDGTRVPLRLLARASMAQYVPASDIFRWTKAGLAWFEQTFNHPYPWGKYDQIFVPEYNIGAMENPGLVTFNEGYLRRGSASRSERENLATTVLHEMAHMWFGDLVTMSWWDDLWLKESFADFAGTQAASEVTEFTEAWISFRLGRKAWAFTADGLPTTHPIVADIPDVEAARSNFDGITYAKGACVLRQLAAYVGLETFYTAASAYFAQHAFANAGLNDWLEALELVSGRDMRRWSERWLETAGTDTLSIEDGVIRCDAPSATNNVQLSRPHRFTVTTFDDAAWSNPRTAWVDLDDSAALTQNEEEVQLLDPDGWTFAISVPDKATCDALLQGLSALPEVSWRAAAWEQLWQSVRHARLAPETFLSAAKTHLLAETEPAIVGTVTAQAQLITHRYLLDGSSQKLWANALWHLARRGFDTSHGEVHLAWRKALIAASASDGAIIEMHKILDGIGFMDVDQDERWHLLTNLAALGALNESEIQDAVARERLRDTSTRARSSALAVFGAMNTTAAKTKAFESLADTTLSNDDVAAIVRGVTQPASVIHARHLADGYFASLDMWWQTRTQVIASLLARGLFACTDSADAAERWLAEHPDAPGSLRRIIIEEDALEKVALGARAMSTGEAPSELPGR